MIMPQAVNCPIANIGTHKNTNKEKKRKKNTVVTSTGI